MAEEIEKDSTLKELPSALVETGKENVQFFANGLANMAGRITKLAGSVDEKVHNTTREWAEGVFTNTLNREVDNIPEWRLGIDELTRDIEKLSPKIINQDRTHEIDSANWIPKDFKSLDEWANSSDKFRKTFLEALGSYVPIVLSTGAGGIAGGTAGSLGAGATTSFFLNASANFADLSTRFDEDTALLKSFGYAMPQAVMDYIPVGKLLSAGIQKKQVANTLYNALLEGGTEGMQQVIQTIARIEDKTSISGWADAFDRGAWQEIFVEAAVGAAVGVSASTVVGVAAGDGHVSGGDQIDAMIKDIKAISDQGAKNKGILAMAEAAIAQELEESPADTTKGIEEEANINKELKKTKKEAKGIEAELKVAREAATPGSPLDIERIKAEGDLPFRTVNINRLPTEQVANTTLALEKSFEDRGLIDPAVLDVQPDNAVVAESIESKKAIVEKYENEKGMVFRHLLKEVEETKMSLSKLNSKLITHSKVLNDGFVEYDAFVERANNDPTSMTTQDWLQFAGLSNFLAVYEPSNIGIQVDLGRAVRSFGIELPGDNIIDMRTADLSEFAGNVDVQGQIEAAADAMQVKSRMLAIAHKMKGQKKQKTRLKELKKDFNSGAFGRLVLAFRQANLLSNFRNRSSDFAGSIIQRSMTVADNVVSSAIGQIPGFRNDTETRGTTFRGTAARLASEFTFFGGAPAAVSRGMKAFGRALSKASPAEFKDYLDTLTDVNRATQQESQKAPAIEPLSAEGIKAAIQEGKDALSSLKDAVIPKQLKKTKPPSGKLHIDRARNTPPKSRTTADWIWNLVDQVAKGNAVLGFGVIQALDGTFRRMAMRSEIAGIIMDEAQLAVRRGEITKQQVTVYVEKMSEAFQKFQDGKIKESPENAPLIEKFNEWDTEAKGEARRVVFQQPLGQTAKIDERPVFVRGSHNLNSFLNRHPLVKAWSIPFLPTAVNLLREGANHTPLLAMLNKKGFNDAMGHNGQKAQNDHIARQVVGGMVIGIAMALDYDERLVGTFAKGTRKAKEAAKILENSVKIGNQWIQFKKFQPLAFILTSVADALSVLRATDFDNPDDYPQLVGLLINVVGGNLLNNSYTKNLYDIFQAVYDNDGSKMFDLVTDLIPSMVPAGGFVQAVTDPFSNDPVLREYKDFIDQLRTKIPGVDKPEVKLDVLGAEVEREPALTVFDDMLDFFNVRRSRGTDSVARKEMARLGLTTRDLGDSMQLHRLKVDLSKQELRTLQELVGVHMEDKLNELVEKPFYTDRETSDYARKKAMERTIGSVRLWAKQVLAVNTDSVQEKLNVSKDELIELLSTPGGDIEEAQENIKNLLKGN